MASYQLRSSFPEHSYSGLDLGSYSIFVKVFLLIVFAPLVVFITAIIRRISVRSVCGLRDQLRARAPYRCAVYHV